MLLPKKVKHRKWQKRSPVAPDTRGTMVAFGAFGLKAMEEHWVKSNQIEAARRAMTKFIEKSGKIWIRVFPDRPVTKKGTEVPMGGGKGAPDHFVAVCRPGTILFEMGGIPAKDAQAALRLASHKIGAPTKLMVRE
jgi:large subunit ribosomal protein L16